MIPVYKKSGEKSTTWLHSGAFALLLATASGCGVVGLGTANDPTPNQTLRATGNFGGGTTGSAMIYGDNGSYTLRLVTFQAPNISSLQAVISASGTTFSTIALTENNGGTKNYVFSGATGAIFTAVTIHSPSTNTDYGVAPMISH